MIGATTNLAADNPNDDDDDDDNYVDEDSEITYTNTWAVRIFVSDASDDADADADADIASVADSVASELGFRNEGPILWKQDGVFQFRHPEVPAASSVPHHVDKKKLVACSPFLSPSYLGSKLVTYFRVSASLSTRRCPRRRSRRWRRWSRGESSPG